MSSADVWDLLLQGRFYFQYNTSVARAIKITGHPCPFCTGDHAVVMSATPLTREDLNAYTDDTGHFIRCRHCGAQGPVTDTPVSALRLWRTRLLTDMEG